MGVVGNTQDDFAKTAEFPKFVTVKSHSMYIVHAVWKVSKTMTQATSNLTVNQ